MSNTSADISIEGYSFVCVPLSQSDFNDIAAIYAIVCVKEDRSWFVLDVGQSGEVGSRIDSHDRKECWKEYCPTGNIWVCVHKMPSSTYTKDDRLERERIVRYKTSPNCGET